MGRTRPLKLLVVGLSWPPETFLMRLLVGLAESGVEVQVAAPKRPDIQAVHWIPTRSWSGSTSMRLLRSAMGAVQAWLRSPEEARLVFGGTRGLDSRQRARARHDLGPLIGRDWDVLYCPWNSAAAAHLPMFRAGKPVVVSCRGSQINIAPSNPTRQAEVGGYFSALDRSAAIHCVSHALRGVVEAHGEFGDRVRVIQPAVDPSFFSPVESAKKPRNNVEITTVGSLLWKKGYETLLLAMQAIRASGVKAHLRIVGDGPERQRVLYTIGDLGLNDAVDLVGSLDESLVRDELRRADLFVLASYSEGISNAALEAMSCGLPVVTTDVGGMAEAIRDGVEGRLVPPRDPAAMAEAIASLCGNREQRLEMGAAARARVLRDFDLANHIDAWRELLASVVTQTAAGERG